MRVRDKIDHVRWWLRKLTTTFRICHTIFMARMLGKYVHSIHDHEKGAFAVYEWKGRKLYIPNDGYTGKLLGVQLESDNG